MPQKSFARKRAGSNEPQHRDFNASSSTSRPPKGDQPHMKKDGTVLSLTQTQIAEKAGISERQVKTAVRVANDRSRHGNGPKKGAAPLSGDARPDAQKRHAERPALRGLLGCQYSPGAVKPTGAALWQPADGLLPGLTD
jgi:hypothetical protein